MDFKGIVEVVVKGVEAAGIAVIILGAIFATYVALKRLLRKETSVYGPYRRVLGRSILLGLEFLVAADIIRTVIVAFNFENVVMLGLIVLIRTFLSFSLELEITGRWPWQKGNSSDESVEV
ncbi:DUF1622 domain-containing protein [Arthrobacter sp. H14]|uniref:DUF1622 domain-containing protein n=1 Tax=Arthrobacter sp. H14 TaxID=1312959 RepID=UPI00047A5187|nr:DUF1622 domain-containing protein [Arthrobacter sp. H14]